MTHVVDSFYCGQSKGKLNTVYEFGLATDFDCCSCYLQKIHVHLTPVRMVAHVNMMEMDSNANVQAQEFQDIFVKSPVRSAYYYFSITHLVLFIITTRNSG